MSDQWLFIKRKKAESDYGYGIMGSHDNENLHFAAGITLYNPEEVAIDRLESYLDCFDIVIAYDNSDVPDEMRLKRLSYLQNHHRFYLIGGHGNEGLPIAFNSMMSHPSIAGIDYFCTLDQDSKFESRDIARIESYLNANRYAFEKTVGILAPVIDYGGGRVLPKLSPSTELVDQRYVITSGSFVNLGIMRAHGLSYDVNYFIDKFEVDLCMQMRRLGLRVACYGGATLYQRLGEAMPGGRSSHSVVRHYYLFRNRFYFNHKWFLPPKRWILDVLQTARHISRILLYENEKTAKLAILHSAFADFLNNSMGSREDNEHIS